MTVDFGNDILAELNVYVGSLNQELFEINKFIYNNPEVKWQEHKAHDVLCNFLERKGFDVTRHAYGMETAFKAVYGNGGRAVEFNAEYDALPDIGHGCGHNLIATVGLTGFLCLSYLLKKYSIAGRAILLGTPAEEGGGGKIELLKAGAYDDADISLMGHAFPDDGKTPGNGGTYSLACQHFTIEFKGKTAHAAGNPYDGVNALDAAVGAYNNISMLRQQLKTNQRIHGIFLDGPKAANVIPQYAKMLYYVRAGNKAELSALMKRVEPCFEASALATGCTCNIEKTDAYDDLRVYRSLAQRYTDNMKHYDIDVAVEANEVAMGSTDQGNVCYKIPSLHVWFTVPTEKTCSMHHIDFTKAVGTTESHQIATKVARSLAKTGWDVLTDDSYFQEIRDEWDRDVKIRNNID